MESEEIWMDLRALHRHVWSISALAREFHLNRRTVSRELEAVEPRRYPDRAAKHPTSSLEGMRGFEFGSLETWRLSALLRTLAISRTWGAPRPALPEPAARVATVKPSAGPSVSTRAPPGAGARP